MMIHSIEDKIALFTVLIGSITISTFILALNITLPMASLAV